MAIIGIDVSKAKLDCLWLRDSISLKVKSKMFPNTSAGHQDLLAWAVKQTGEAATDLHYVMEATGIYHEGLAYALQTLPTTLTILSLHPNGDRGGGASLIVPMDNTQAASHPIL